VVSAVDGGTLDLVRSLGGEVVSSADLIQAFVARWSEAAYQEHRRASQRVAEVKDAAFDLIRKQVASGQPVTERDVQQFIVARFDAAGMEYPDPPIVAVNAHSGDPHFEVSPTNPAPIRNGDWVLIDLWARTPGDENIYSDITWVGFVGRDVPRRHREVFAAVKAARDAAVARGLEAWKARRPVAGFELDDAARSQLIDRGLQSFIRHRTGHSLSPGKMVHGLGVNLDNLETHDTRLVVPGLGYTIEPGAYLPEFGVRLEINVYVHPEQGPTITSCVQDEVVLLA
jgi:Xaa-Pro aminopeptidase